MGAQNNDYVARLELEGVSSEDIRIRELVGKESISQLFSFDVDVVMVDGPDLVPDEILGAKACLVFTQEPDGNEVRRMYTMVSSIRCFFETEVKHRSYKLRLVPHAHRLTLIEMQEIFLDLSIPEILQQKAANVGIEIDLRLLGTYPKLPFVVQYKETDLAFVSRLTEHLGISFFFEHPEDREMDVLVFTDHQAGFRPIANDHEIPFRSRGEEIDVFRFELETQLIPAHYIQYEYNHELPRLSLEARHDAAMCHGGGVIEYGSHYDTPAAGEAIARIRAEERAAKRSVYHGQGDVCSMSAGGTFSLEGHHAAPASLLIVGIEHHASQPVLLEGGKSSAPTYKNAFQALDAKTRYRPSRQTPRPRIHGLIPALVEPKADGEIGKYAQIDADGSYTLRFFFDTSDPGSRSRSSLPIRMLQPHAGPNYGLHFPLKPGIEVLVGFIDGDPDRPVIVGAVPNPMTRSPVTQNNSIMNRLESASGVFFEIRDI